LSHRRRLAGMAVPSAKRCPSSQREVATSPWRCQFPRSLGIWKEVTGRKKGAGKGFALRCSVFLLLLVPLFWRRSDSAQEPEARGRGRGAAQPLDFGSLSNKACSDSAAPASEAARRFSLTRRLRSSVEPRPGVFRGSLQGWGLRLPPALREGFPDGSGGRLRWQ
jgi:hypothetical protein